MGGIDILINNAGGVSAGRLEDTPKSHIEKMIDVNLLAPILLIRAAMQDLRDAGDSMVVNASSGIALVGVPFYSTYAAVRSEEHTSELQSLMRRSYAVFCLKKNKNTLTEN